MTTNRTTQILLDQLIENEGEGEMHNALVQALNAQARLEVKEWKTWLTFTEQVEVALAEVSDEYALLSAMASELVTSPIVDEYNHVCYARTNIGKVQSALGELLQYSFKEFDVKAALFNQTAWEMFAVTA